MFQAIFSLCHFEKCKQGYNTSIFTRCLLYTDPITLSGSRSIGLFLYPKSKSEIMVKSLTYPEIILNSTTPGIFTAYYDHSLSLTCTGDDCDISIWCFDAFYINEFYLLNAAGALISLNQETISQPYCCLFDFGPSTRVKLDKLEHSKLGTSVIVTYFDTEKEELVEEKYVNGEHTSIEFSSPGMFEIHESVYTPVTVNAVMGSVKKLPSEFTYTPFTGGAVVQTYSYGFSLWDPKLEFIVHSAKQSRVFEVLSIVLKYVSIITGVLGALGIILSIIYTFSLRNLETHPSKRSEIPTLS